jgi:hypothetical protein
LRLHSIVIDADASPSGYVAWYNHSTGARKIRAVRPAIKNERFGVQRMEMLAIYFALADNLKDIKRKAGRLRKRRIIIAVRSDSKSTVEQLLGLSQIRDGLMRRISSVIAKLLAKARYAITFDHLDRSRNRAGLLIEEERRRERERMTDHLQIIPLCA